MQKVYLIASVQPPTKGARKIGCEYFVDEFTKYRFDAYRIWKNRVKETLGSFLTFDDAKDACLRGMKNQKDIEEASVQYGLIPSRKHPNLPGELVEGIPESKKKKG